MGTASGNHRRGFLKSASAVTAGAVSAWSVGIRRGKASPNEKIAIGILGCGGRANQLLEYLLKRTDIEITTVCDVNTAQFPRIVSQIDDATGKAPKREQDFRRMLDDKNIDAVQIATGHNWHALATIYACQAGKDVYVEKPCSLTLFEGRQAVKAARKYDRVVQVGNQARSGADHTAALAYLQGGKLGDVHLIRGREQAKSSHKSPGPEVKTAPVPDGLDWDIWCGPAPKPAYAEGTWWQGRWDYGLGWGDHAAHQLDMMRAYAGKQYPSAVLCSGGLHYWKDGRDLPDSVYVIYEYEDLNITYEAGNWMSQYKTPFHTGTDSIEKRNWAMYNQVSAVGTEGVMFAGRRGGGWQVYNRQGLVETFQKQEWPDGLHIGNWIDCIRTRQRPIADIEEAHLSMAMLHLANASYRAGRIRIEFDAATETITNVPEANKFLKRAGRAPWLIPEIV